ncbi:MAG: ABC transporter ATP-binding protein [Christensenellales bacterium]|jgi:ABC-2 type transport system ATP-binding protein
MRDMIVLKDISMCYKMTKEKVDSLKEYFLRKIKRNLEYEQFWALKDISFEVKQGELMGLVGLNGSGKSTLLKLIAGVMKPTTGQVSVFGSIAPLIELGAGFDMDLTARENIFLNGAILGHSHKVMQSKFDEIMDFSELHGFVDVALKNYSSGMVARLAFAIATAIQPELLLVDEILSVGDFKFQEKCHQRIADMVNQGVTVVLVSHTIEQIRELCTRVVWIDHGQMRMIGETQEVCDAYLSM